MRQRHPDNAASGFSLIEVIVVIALIAFVYTVALPQMNQKTGAEVATKLAEVAGDVRSAFDLSVLTGKTYRMVFVMNSGDYWLEEADREDIFLGSDKVDRDQSEAEEKDAATDFDQRFAEYKDLAGQAVTEEKSGHEIAPTSPVMTAKDKLKPPAWARVESLEWSKRSLGPMLMIRDMQAEHHGHKQELLELGPEARGMIYFFPGGYVERSVIHIAFKKDDMTPDDSQEAYTLTTNPYEGTAEVEPGNQDVDVHADKNT
jgi:prepilin-type N-terminal cleavage/methylation domain-containing protein